MGYVPNQPQSESVRFSLRVLYALLPCLCNLAAFAVALAYPISGKVHSSILAAIDDRKNGRPVLDPLNRREALGEA
jgi:GPH family glycoside/pentoside/hexuronide:cation symporter